MSVRSGRVVLLRIRYHKTEVCLEGKPVLVHACLDFGAHGAEIHRILDDLVITILLRQKMSKVIIKVQTLEHGLEQGPLVA